MQSSLLVTQAIATIGSIWIRLLVWYYINRYNKECYGVRNAWCCRPWDSATVGTWSPSMAVFRSRSWALLEMPTLYSRTSFNGLIVIEIVDWKQQRPQLSQLIHVPAPPPGLFAHGPKPIVPGGPARTTIQSSELEVQCQYLQNISCQPRYIMLLTPLRLYLELQCHQVVPWCDVFAC